MEESSTISNLPNTLVLRSLQARIASAIDQYEGAANNPLAVGLAATEITKAATELLLEAEDPLKRLFVISHQAAQVSALRSAIGIGLFNKFPETGDVTLEELAEATGAESALLVRLLRTFSAMSYTKETGIHRYTLTRHGKCLQLPKYQSIVVSGFDLHFLADAKIPEFLESTGWKNPTNALKAPFNLAYPGKKSLFQHISETPGLMEHFHTTMMATKDFGLYNAVDEVPWPQILGMVENDKVALVDMGGADGSVLSQILHKYPELTGRFILQDLPDVIERSKDKLYERITAMPHDFFKEQVVKGARAYHLRMIFHDWPIDDCKRILRMLKPALQPGYSKLLVTDAVIPDTGASLLHTTLDLAMMVIAAEEKSEELFRQILQDEGFIIRKVWRSTIGVDSMFEAEIPI